MKVLFVSIGSYGFMMPALAAAQEVARRGHTPVFFTAPNGRALVQQAGFSFIPEQAGWTGLRTNGWWTPNAIVPQFRQIEAAVQQASPEVMVTDHLAVGTCMAARTLGVPLAVLGPVSYLHALPGHPYGAGSDEHRTRVGRYRAHSKGYNLAATKLGLPTIPTDIEEDSPCLGDQYLLRSVPSFELYTTALPRQVRFVGAALHEMAPRQPVLDEWLHAGSEQRPLAFIQLEKLFDFRDPLPDVFALVHKQGLRAVAALGPLAAQYRELTSDSIYVTEHVPQGQVLPHARFVVSGGHPTAVLGAIVHGLPNVIIDFGSGAPEFRRCCVEAGAGLGIDYDLVTVDSLGPVLERAANDELMALAARRVQREFAAIDSFPTIVDILEELGGLRAAPASGLNRSGP